MTALSTEMVDAMIAAGLTREQMAALMKVSIVAEETKLAEKRAKDAERQRRSRERRGLSRRVTVTDGDSGDPPGSPPKDPGPQNTPPLPPAGEGAAGAGARPLPSKSRFDEVETTCRDALGKLAPIDLVIGPVVQLADERGMEATLPAMIDAARSSRSPIRTWALLAVKARERLDAPPIHSIPTVNGAQHHGPHRKRTLSDVGRDRLAFIEREEREATGTVLQIRSG